LDRRHKDRKYSREEEFIWGLKLMCYTVQDPPNPRAEPSREQR